MEKNPYKINKPYNNINKYTNNKTNKVFYKIYKKIFSKINI